MKEGADGKRGFKGTYPVMGRGTADAITHRTFPFHKMSMHAQMHALHALVSPKMEWRCCRRPLDGCRLLVEPLEVSASERGTACPPRNGCWLLVAPLRF